MVKVGIASCRQQSSNYFHPPPLVSNSLSTKTFFIWTGQCPVCWLPLSLLICMLPPQLQGPGGWAEDRKECTISFYSTLDQPDHQVKARVVKVSEYWVLSYSFSYYSDIIFDCAWLWNIAIKGITGAKYQLTFNLPLESNYC